MNHKANSIPKLDLKLNLSPPWPYPQLQAASSPTNRSVSLSPPSSCVSSLELSPDHHHHRCFRYPSSPEAKTMMLVGCPQCLMYVMLSEDDPKCPKCKSTVLLQILHEEITTKRTQK
ncbi:unnamed protein product [Camellia sinensis]|uniref:GIR1-like zinc ribbon domain-containing protein n=1 Tax=Camellia sinensis var. sinensis TaxID=542762 RepID=A0A4S4DT42_CAMSN|nr:hypothetical protein TEA_011057 [Camellia sinensis var. sinensis]